MSEIDWSKAPEGCIGALVAKKNNVHYPKVTFASLIDIRGSGFKGRACEGYDLCAYAESWEWHRRPSQAWSGEGKPPVGTVCQWFSPIYGWLGGKVVGHDGTLTVIAHNDGYTGCHPHEVRPIRTPEQIAADEREREREQALREACEIVGCAPGSMYGNEVVKKLIDAGYRKQEQPK